MEKFSTKRFESFKSCLFELDKSRTRDYQEDFLILSGIVLQFNMTFDLAWKVMKDIVTFYHGLRDYALGSPRENLEAAYRCGIIEDDEMWLEILNVRNRLVHDYNLELAKAKADKIVNVYVDFFLAFRDSLEKYLADIKNT